MESVNVTIRIDKETKREFDIFCENVGINTTTAFNMFVKATLRTRELPFIITDNEPKRQARNELKEAFRAAQEQSIINGTDKMTLDEINAEIKQSRKERKARLARSGGND
jgi:DNA-damage-inducible protein J